MTLPLLHSPDGHNQDIQFLRGIAILFVFVEHYLSVFDVIKLAPDWFLRVAFWCGVDLFFVISGFLVTNKLLDALSTPVTSRFQVFSGFIKRRIRRLAPAAGFWLGCSLVVYPLLPGVDGASFTQVAATVLAAASGTANLYWPLCEHGFLPLAACAGESVNPAYWSLSMEEQFYLLLVLFLVFWSRHALLTVLAVICLLSLALPWGGAWSWGWSLRPFALSFGVIIAFIDRCRPGLFDFEISRSERVLYLVGALSALPFLASLWFTLTGPGMAMTAVLVALLSSAAFVLCLEGSRFTKNPIGEMLAWIGSRSYSLYLSHILVLTMLHGACEYMGVDGPSALAVMFVVTLCLALTIADWSYKALERRYFRNAALMPKNIIAVRAMGSGSR